MLRKLSDPEYYNKEMKRLKVKVKEAHNRRLLEHPYREELKRPSKQLLLTN
jgi:hypothetical protein